MSQKLFEVAGDCAMPGLPSGADIERVGERLEQARRAAPQVVRTAVQGPAAFKDRAYVLEGRFAVWADDGERAVTTIESLLDGAKIPYRGLHLSGRALSAADVPRPRGAADKAESSRTDKAPAKAHRPARVRAGAARSGKGPSHGRVAARGKKGAGRRGGRRA